MAHPYRPRYESSNHTTKKGEPKNYIFNTRNANEVVPPSSTSDVGVIRPPCLQRKFLVKEKRTADISVNFIARRNQIHGPSMVQGDGTAKSPILISSSRDSRIEEPALTRLNKVNAGRSRHIENVWGGSLSVNRTGEDVLDHAFNAMERIACPQHLHSQIQSSERDAIDGIFESTEKLICSQDADLASISNVMPNSTRAMPPIPETPRRRDSKSKEKEMEALLRSNPRKIRPVALHTTVMKTTHQNDDMLDKVFTMVESHLCPADAPLVAGQSRRDGLDLVCEGTENALCRERGYPTEACREIGNTSKSELLEYVCRGIDEVDVLYKKGKKMVTDTKGDGDVLDEICEKMESAMCDNMSNEVSYDDLNLKRLSLMLEKNRTRTATEKKMDVIFSASDIALLKKGAHSNFETVQSTAKQHNETRKDSSKKRTKRNVETRNPPSKIRPMLRPQTTKEERDDVLDKRVGFELKKIASKAAYADRDVRTTREAKPSTNGVIPRRRRNSALKMKKRAYAKDSDALFSYQLLSEDAKTFPVESTIIKPPSKRRQEAAKIRRKNNEDSKANQKKDLGDTFYWVSSKPAIRQE